MTDTTTTRSTPPTSTMTPTERLLTGALLVAPLVYLAADSTYAARGFDNATGGVLHVLGAIAYGFVALRVAAWLPSASRLAALVLFTGIVGMAGNVAWGFDTIHLSLGDVQLVDQPGAANLIKPLGFFVPLCFAMIAWACARLGHRWQAGLILLSAIGWPIAHVGNIGPLAVAVNIGLVVAFGSVAWSTSRQPSTR